MANNRMFLVHKRTGARVMIAKYYPSLGWFMYSGCPEHFNQWMDKEVAASGNLSFSARMIGPTDFEIRFESCPDKEREI